MRSSILALSFCLALAARAEAQNLDLRLPLSLEVGQSPADMLVADLNADQHLDIVSTNFLDGTITVQLGTGTGEFTQLDPMPASSGPLEIAPLFADADANLDLVVSEAESDFIFLLRGNGDGTFQEATPIGAGHDPFAIAVGDLNHDQHSDLVVTLAAEGSGSVNVLLGDGDGGLVLDESKGQRLNDQAFAVAVGDFDEDDNLDVAAATLGRPPVCDMTKCGTLAILKGDGTGQLGVPAYLATGSTPTAVAVADLNGDHHVDIVTTDAGDNMLTVFIGDGHGNFARTQRTAVGNSPAALTLIDVDGDEHLDAVVGNRRSGDVTVLLGQADGTFASIGNFLSGVTLTGAGAGDFNEDRRTDLAAVNEGDGNSSASVLLARAEGGFDAIQSLMPTQESNGVAAGDARGDGLPTLGLSVTAVSGVQMFYPQGVQDFQGPVTANVDIRPTLAALRDLDGDGRADLITTAANESHLSVALSTGDGFATAHLLNVAGTPGGLAVADIDGDGHLDLATAISSTPSASILYGNGDGTFAAAAAVTLGGRPGGVAVGDFNRDGRADLAVGNAQTSAVSLIFGDAGRNPGGATLTVSAAPGNLTCADLDADGNDDLVITAGTHLRVYFGDGAGGFTPGPQLQTGRPVTGLAARDVTGDLQPDVLATLQGTNNLAIFVNRGDRSFASSQQLVLGLRPGGIAVADFDGDGRYDIAVSGSDGWVISGDGEGAVLRGDGNGDGAFSVADHLALQSARARGWRVEDIRRGPDTVHAGADANGDGLLDDTDRRALSAKIFR